MTNIYKFIFLIPLLTLGCKSTISQKTMNFQKIDSFNMKIYSKEGEKIYSLKSPNSSYDRSKHSFILGQTTINLFRDKQLKYIINSDKSELSNNNKVLKLMGNVQLKTILQDNDILYADNFTWNINESKYVLIGDVTFENKTVILSSNKATLNSDNIIEFFNPVKYKVKNDSEGRSYEIYSENAFYNINTKSVSFKAKEEQVRSKIYF